MKIPTLPSAVSAYVEATNSFNLARFVAAFGDDALVNDHRDEFVGKEQIRAWAAREIIGDRVTMKVVDVRILGDHVALKAEVDGDFDKKGLPAPLVLSFYFSVERDRIVQLVIVHNKRPLASVVPDVAGTIASAEAHKRTVRRFFDLFAAGQVPAVIALFHDDATYWFPSTRKTLTMSEFAESLTWIQTRLDGPIAFEVGTMVADDRAVAAQVECFATTATGKRYNNLYHVYFEFEGDRIRKAREYNDTAHVFATLRAGQSAT
jgi:ketosteroid isomerase-like protein